MRRPARSVHLSCAYANQHSVIELHEQRRRQRYSAAQAFGATGAAAVAPQADAVNGLQPHRGAQIGELAIGLGHLPFFADLRRRKSAFGARDRTQMGVCF